MINGEQLIDLYLAAVEGADEPHRTSTRAIGSLADFYGVKAADIMRCIEAAGVELPPLDEPNENKKERNIVKYNKWTPEMDADVDRMREDGMTFEAIGEKYGISAKGISSRWYGRHKPKVNEEFEREINKMIEETANERECEQKAAEAVPAVEAVSAKTESDSPACAEALKKMIDEAVRMALCAGMDIVTIDARLDEADIRVEVGGNGGGVDLWRRR